MTKSAALGKHTSNNVAEILNLDPLGVWILVNDKEYFLDHEKYPWFLKAKIENIFNVSMVAENHVRWEDLDVDLDVHFLENPEAAPLVYR